MTWLENPVIIIPVSENRTSWWIGVAREGFSSHAVGKIAQHPLDPAIAQYFDTLDRQLEAELREAWVEVVPEPEEQA